MKNNFFLIKILLISSLFFIKINIKAQGVQTFQSIRLYHPNTAGQYITLLPPNIITNYGLTLPATQGAAGTVMTNDGSGNMTWTNPSSNAWIQGGNTLTSLQNLGSISNHDLPFITNNVERMRISNTGNVGIGITPTYKLDIFAASDPVRIQGLSTGTSTDSILTLSTTGLLKKVTLTQFSARLGGSFWGLYGNAGTIDGTNFIGTTDNIPFNFKVNGQKAGRISNNSGNGETFFGYKAGNANVSSFGMTAIGYQAGLLSTGGNNTFVGFNTGSSNISGSNNSFLGTNAGVANTATDNTFLGFKAGLTNTSGQTNTFVGSQAGELNLSANQNTFVGFESGKTNSVGAANTYLGYHAGRLATGSNNVFLGKQTGKDVTSGENNTIIGSEALYLNTLAWGNTAVGFRTLYNNTKYGNVAVGDSALYLSNIGGRNTAIGYQSGLTNTSGSNNTFLGYGSDVTGGGFTNAAAIGYNAKVGASNSLILGGTGTDAVSVGIGLTTPLSTAKLHVVNTGTNHAFYAPTTTNYNYFAGKTAFGNFTNDPTATAMIGSTAESRIHLQDDITVFTAPIIEGIGSKLKLNASSAVTTGVFGINSRVHVPSGNTQNFTGNLHAANLDFKHYGTGTVTIAYGAIVRSANMGAGRINKAYGILTDVNTYSTGQIDSSFALMIGNTSATANVVNGYGLFIGTMPGSNTVGIGQFGLTNRNFFMGNVGIGLTEPLNKFDVAGSVVVGTGYAGSATAPTNGLLIQGNVGIGTTTPAATLDMGSKTDAIILPKGTTAQRPATPQSGMVRYNTSLGRMEYYNGSSWVAL